jgi:hypothetical protein
MIYLYKIVTWIKNLKLTKTDILYICVVALILLLLQQCNLNSNLKEDINKVQTIANREINNYKANQDTIAFERNKNKELVAKKMSYEYDINTLTNENKKIIKEYQASLNLVKDIKKINSLLKVNIEAKDSIINSNLIITNVNDSTSILKFNDEKNWDKYNWRRFYATIDLSKGKDTLKVTNSSFVFEQGIELKVAILNDGGVNSLKITSPYPNIEFTNIENINLVNDKLNKKNEKKAGWSVGFGVGYGLNLTPGSIINLGPSINIGLLWSPKWLRF